MKRTLLKTNIIKKTMLFIAAFLISPAFYAVTWHVGSSQTYTTISAVVNLVQNGDTIKIDGGVYLNDPVKWTKTDLVFIGMGTGINRTIMQWNGGDISNGKGIWVFENPSLTGNITIDNIVFDGARVSDGDGGNGAGIRYQAKDLTIRNCLFHSCQNGILEGGSYTGSVVTIQNTEFNNNGYEVTGGAYSGYEHNIYISSATDSLLVKNCYFHDPRGEANSLKTRAQKSYILYNVIDEANGQGSWELNIAQGGLCVVIGNTIVQGAGSINHGIIGYDAATNPIEDFYFINNTVVNKYAGNFNVFNIVPSSGINKFKVYNNIFTTVSGGNLVNFISGSSLDAAIDTASNRISANYTTVGFVNAAAGDFHLTSSALSVIDHCVSAGTASNGFSLLPVYQFVSFGSPLASRLTTGSSNDIGAFEYGITTEINQIISRGQFAACYPNPATNNFTIDLNPDIKLDNVQIVIYDMIGKEVKRVVITETKTIININNELKKGLYSYSIIVDNQKSVFGKLIVQ